MAKRIELTLSDKVTLLDNIKSLPPHASHRFLSETLTVSRSTIARLINEEQNLLNKFSQKELMKHGKLQRAGKDPEVEEALNK